MVTCMFCSVSKIEVVNQAPNPYTDFLEQFIDYKTPADKFDAQAVYGGSVIAERRKGELSARCDNKR
jgi:hypothetical protein